MYSSWGGKELKRESEIEYGFCTICLLNFIGIALHNPAGISYFVFGFRGRRKLLIFFFRGRENRLLTKTIEPQSFFL